MAINKFFVKKAYKMNDFTDIIGIKQEKINRVYIAIYSAEGELLTGCIPDGYIHGRKFDNKEIQTVIINQHEYYIYDKKEDDVKGYDKVWVRGFISIENSEENMLSLMKATGILLPLLIILIVAGGYFVAKRAFLPLEKMNQAADKISEGNDLSKRIPLGAYQDEIYKMGITVNNMLARLEKSFRNEKQFTSDASHELRTPTSVILSQCEFSLENAKSQEDYIEALEVIQRQAKKCQS